MGYVNEVFQFMIKINHRAYVFVWSVYELTRREMDVGSINLLCDLGGGAGGGARVTDQTKNAGSTMKTCGVFSSFVRPKVGCLTPEGVGIVE